MFNPNSFNPFVDPDAFAAQYRVLQQNQQDAASAATPPAAAGAPAPREEQRLPPPRQDNPFMMRALRDALPGSQSARYPGTRIDRVHTPPPDYDSMLRTPVDELTRSVERESASPPPEARPGPSQSMRLPGARAVVQPEHPFFPSAFARAVGFWGAGDSREAAAQRANIRPEDLRRYVGSDGLTAEGRQYVHHSLAPAYQQEVLEAVERRRRGGGVLRSLGRMFGFGGSSSRAAPPPAPLPRSGGYDASVVRERERSSRWEGDVLAGTGRAATAAPGGGSGGRLPKQYSAIMGLLPDYAVGVPLPELRQRVDCDLIQYLHPRGSLGNLGRKFHSKLSLADQAKLDTAIADRQAIHLIGPERFARAMNAFSLLEHSLAQAAAQAGVREDELCHLRRLLTEDGLTPLGQAYEARLGEAFLHDRPAHYEKIMGLLDDYAIGVPLLKLQERGGNAFKASNYFKADGGLGNHGRQFRNQLNDEDKAKLDEAIANRQAIGRIGPKRFRSVVETFPVLGYNPAQAAAQARVEESDLRRLLTEDGLTPLGQAYMARLDEALSLDRTLDLDRTFGRTLGRPAHYEEIMGLLDDYAAGVRLSELQKRVDFNLNVYLKANGGIRMNGTGFRKLLNAEDKAKLDKAVADRQAVSRIDPDRFARAAQAFSNPARSLAAVAAEAGVLESDLGRFLTEDGLTPLGQAYTARQPQGMQAMIHANVGLRQQLRQQALWAPQPAIPQGRWPGGPSESQSSFHLPPTPSGGWVMPQTPDLNWPPASPAVSSQPAGGVDDADLAWALSNIEAHSFRSAIHALGQYRGIVTDVDTAAQFAQMPGDHLGRLLQSGERNDHTSWFQLTPLGEAYVNAQFSYAEGDSLRQILGSR